MPVALFHFICIHMTFSFEPLTFKQRLSPNDDISVLMSNDMCGQQHPQSGLLDGGQMLSLAYKTPGANSSEVPFREQV